MRAISCFLYVVMVSAVRNTFTPGNGPIVRISAAAEACLEATSVAAKANENVAPVLKTFHDGKCKVWDAMKYRLQEINEDGTVVIAAPHQRKVQVKIICTVRNAARRELIWTHGDTDIRVTGLFLLGEKYVTVWTSDGSARTVEVSLSELDVSIQKPSREAVACKQATFAAASGVQHELPVMQEFVDTECKTWDAMVARFNEADITTAHGAKSITLMEASNGMKLKVKMNEAVDNDVSKQLVWEGENVVSEVSGMFLMGELLTIYAGSESGEQNVLATGELIKCSLGEWLVVTEGDAENRGTTGRKIIPYLE